ncbi:hypothetical protein CVT25_012743 [Psilocybe cyanescens]|uniref:Hemerythrin-like domain-containing protein n=1 Tax=Psilocybe cyanescens TaxID=93625 RepID=A0A409XSK0_PSICY|nr:hypothetical protein CVT25_012743 [Psilocybe cyanescens]
MFPLALFPTVPDNLQDMKARDALVYQNTFMKNALIRALNITYEMARKIEAVHPEFCSFLAYMESVCNILSLHLEGDDVFFQTLSLHCNEVAVVNNEIAIAFRKDLNSLLGLIGEWIESPDSYQHARLQDCLKKIESSITEVLHTQMSRFRGDALPNSIDDETLRVLVRGVSSLLSIEPPIDQCFPENMIWFGSRVDIAILLPFCTSHHDPLTSKYWPPVTSDAIEAIPDLARVHPHLWKFAPFDPVTRNATAVAL